MACLQEIEMKERLCVLSVSQPRLEQIFQYLERNKEKKKHFFLSKKIRISPYLNADFNNQCLFYDNSSI